MPAISPFKVVESSLASSLLAQWQKGKRNLGLDSHVKEPLNQILPTMEQDHNHTSLVSQRISVTNELINEVNELISHHPCCLYIFNKVRAKHTPLIGFSYSSEPHLVHVPELIHF